MPFHLTAPSSQVDLGGDGSLVGLPAASKHVDESALQAGVGVAPNGGHTAASGVGVAPDGGHTAASGVGVAPDGGHTTVPGALARDALHAEPRNGIASRGQPARIGHEGDFAVPADGSSSDDDGGSVALRSNPAPENDAGIALRGGGFPVDDDGASVVLRGNPASEDDSGSALRDGSRLGDDDSFAGGLDVGGGKGLVRDDAGAAATDNRGPAEHGWNVSAVDGDASAERCDAPTRDTRDRVEGADPRSAAGTAGRVASAKWDEWQAPTLARILWSDRTALQLLRLSERLTVALGVAARAFVDGRMWTVMGCDRAEDHCRERYGRTARWLRKLAVLGRACDTLPGFERAIAGDDERAPLGRSRAYQVARVATPASVTAWIALARLLDERALQEAVRAARQAKSDWPVVSPAPVASGERPGSAVTSASTEPGAAAGLGRPAFDRQTDGVDSDAEPRSEVRFPVPGPVQVIFDEVLQLHRALSGDDVPVSDFVEALVAESLSGPVPPALDDVERVRLSRGRRVDAIERELARANDNWKWLDRSEPTIRPFGPRDRAFDRLRDSTVDLLHELEDLTAPVGTGDVAALNERIRELVGIEDRIRRGVGELLAFMKKRRAWLRLRFDGVGHYGAARLGLGRRTAQNLARIAAELRHFPRLREAYDAGRVGVDAAILVLRALQAASSGPVTPWLEREWVKQAQDVTVRRLRDEVRVVRRDWALHDSYRPRPPLDDREWLRSLELWPGTIRRRFERLVGVAASPRWRDTLTPLSLRLADGSADDLLNGVEDRRALLETCAQTCSAGEGAAAAQTCSAGEGAAAAQTCSAGEGAAAEQMYSAGEGAAAAQTCSAGEGAAAAQMCSVRDNREVAQLVSAADSASGAQTRSAREIGGATNPRGARSLEDAYAIVAAAKGTPLALKVASAFVSRGLAVPAWVGLLALLEEYVTTWDAAGALPRRRQNRTYATFGFRCACPMCTRRSSIEEHHKKPRSQGGSDEPENLVALCRPHHAHGVHGDTLACVGRSPLGMLWRVGRIDVAEWYVNDRRVDPPPGWKGRTLPDAAGRIVSGL